MQPTLCALFRKAHDAKLAYTAAPACHDADAAPNPFRVESMSTACPAGGDSAQPRPPAASDRAHDAPAGQQDDPGPAETRRCAVGQRVVQTFKRQKATAKARWARPPSANACSL